MEQGERAWLVTERRNAATLKLAMQKCGMLDMAVKLISDAAAIRRDFILPPGLESTENICVVPLARGYGDSKDKGEGAISQLGISEHSIGIATRCADVPPPTATSRSSHDSLADAVHKWLASLQADVRTQLPERYRFSWPALGYRKHGNLLVLSAEALSREPWDALSTYCRQHAPQLFQQICSSLRVTHIVANAPISLTANGGENILRAPVGLQPLYGNFPPIEPPSQEAFQRAFWASTKQNGIHQVFAPMYTMFSNGNITEKKRILSDDIFRQHLSRGPSCVVDLYAGIGYFAFSYARLGYQKVLCWEINEWSVEGLQRGAKLNGWIASVLHDEAQKSKWINDVPLNEKLVVFKESNEHACSRIESLRGKIPPVSHVNCGYLPSSKAIWASALRIIDPVLGGWIHAHENCAEEDVDRRGREIELHLRELVQAQCGEAAAPTVECRHIEQVKSYAPGVIHCVFDILVSESAH